MLAIYKYIHTQTHTRAGEKFTLKPKQAWVSTTPFKKQPEAEIFHKLKIQYTAVETDRQTDRHTYINTENRLQCEYCLFVPIVWQKLAL